MNLTDFERTPPHRAYAAVKREADSLGVKIAGSEIVGLVPQKALELMAGRDLQFEHPPDSMVLEKRLAEAAGNHNARGGCALRPRRASSTGG